MQFGRSEVGGSQSEPHQAAFPIRTGVNRPRTAGRQAASLCLAALLAACVQAPPRTPAPVVTVPPPTVEELPPPPPQQSPRISDAERLLDYYDYALNLPADQLAQEQERTLRFFGQHRSDFALMQLVLLRCLPGATAKDRAQAQEMISSYLKETQDSGSELRPLGMVLRTLLSENQQLEAQLQAQGQKLRDETRRNDELQQKLDALIETERKLLERSKPQRNE